MFIINRNLLIFIILICILIPINLAIPNTQNLVYDANGNLVTGDGYYRVYDGFNHLAQIKTGNSDSGTVLEQFVWHPLEERILVKDAYETNGSWKETVYYIDKDFVQIKNESGDFYYKYIYQNGELIAQEDYTGKKLFFLNDHEGSIQVIVDESGNKVEERFYDPLGEIESAIESAPVLKTYGFYGYEAKERDPITGQYDFNARRFDPGLGIFTQPDPVIKNFFDPQLLNRYSFERNNPYRFIDPTGNIPVTSEMGNSDEVYDYILSVENANPNYNANQVLNIVEKTYRNYIDSGINQQGTSSYSPRYVYTQDRGVIDQKHLFTNAKYGQNIVARSGLFVAQYLVEGWQSTFGGQDYSAFTYEDLVSNQVGRDFGNNLNNKQPLSAQYKQFMGGLKSQAFPQSLVSQMPTTENGYKPSAGEIKYTSKGKALPQKQGLYQRTIIKIKSIFSRGK